MDKSISVNKKQPEKAHVQTRHADVLVENFPKQCSLDLVIPHREKLKSGGIEGRPIMIETNYLSLSLRNISSAIHYDVVVIPDAPKKLLRLAIEEFRLEYFPDRHPAYDGAKNLYSSSKLPFGNHIENEITIIVENGRPKTFWIEITFAAEVDLTALSKYFESTEKRYMINAQEAIQCINVVLRSAPALHCIPVGQSFFTKPRDQIINSLGGGVEMYYGFYQSAILGWKPFLNVGVVHKAFFKTQAVLDLIRELCPTRSVDLSQPLNSKHFEIVQRTIKNLKVQYQIPNQFATTRKFRVNGLDKPASTARFTNENGIEMSVADYFKKFKKYNLRFPNMNCLWVDRKSDELKILIPPELCSICENQMVNHEQLSPNQTAEMIKKSATSTYEYKNKIMNVVRAAYFNENATVKEFGISMDKHFINVPARVLDAPVLCYSKGNVKPERGSWKPRNFIQAECLENWGVVCLDRNTQRQELQRFVEQLIKTGMNLGMQISSPRVMVPKKISYGREREELEQCFERYKSLDLIIIICPTENCIYHYVKQVAELHVGTLTQCLRGATIQRMNPSIVSNILLKINAKLNGVNHKLQIRPPCLRRPCMILGADVTHPNPGQKNTVPSIAVVTASNDPSAFCYSICWRLQPPTQEIITDMAAIVKEHLIRFYKQNNSTKPESIIVFRDGVSEGQFQAVLNAEVHAIRKACYMVQSNGMYKPKITFLVVQKRHHTRFFPTNPRDCIDKNGNVPVGTCVDTEVTHPTDMDFYLLSHASIQGVARPTKYCILWDDANRKEDEIEELAFHLCHLFSRCTRSVSYPAPTYYAHLAATRIRVYCEGITVDLRNLERAQAQMCVKGNLMKDLPMFFV